MDFCRPGAVLRVHLYYNMISYLQLLLIPTITEDGRQLQ